ncbi:MAG: PQQ-binding-like beta-propeller repeat protein [Thermoguttaceae bacterium]|jgi:outer membrane protein assembly factor BamB
MCRCLKWLLLFWPLLDSALAQEWSRFRGPNGSGESEAAGIPTTWADRDYLWRVKLAGQGHSSPVVWANRVYITAADAEDASQLVYCLDSASGTLVWRKQFPSKRRPKNPLNSFASSTPAVDAERIYVTWATDQQYVLVALRREDGQEEWRRDFGPLVAEHGFGASPIVYGDLVIVPNDQDGESRVTAVECATGKTRWATQRRSRKAGYSTPIVYTPPGGQAEIILTSWADGLSSLDPRTGAVRWELDVLTHRTVGSPVIAGGLVFAACGEGGGGKKMVAVRPGDPDKKVEAKVAYEVEGKLPYVVTPVARGNLLFLWSDQGIVTCLDALTGKRLWQERVPGKFFGSPVRAGERLYCISSTGTAVVLAATDQYRLLGQVDLGEPSQSTPAIAGGVMYLRTKSQVMAIGARTSR